MQAMNQNYPSNGSHHHHNGHHHHHQNMMTAQQQAMHDDERRKRHRRTATEIARHYKCPLRDECHKSYGSEGSLNQHIKLKHPEFYAEQVA